MLLNHLTIAAHNIGCRTLTTNAILLVAVEDIGDKGDEGITRTTKELVEGLVQRLTDDIPHGHLDPGAHILHLSCTGHLLRGNPEDLHALHEGLHLKGIEPNEEGATLMDALRNRCTTVGLTNANNPLIRDELNHTACRPMLDAH